MSMLPVLANGDLALVVLLVVGGIIAIAISIGMARQREAQWRNFARTIGGTCVDGGLFSPSGIRFTCGGRPALLESRSGSRNNSSYTRVCIALDGKTRGTLHILKEGFGESFLKMFGAQDLRVGDAAFDRDYVIKAQPESLAGRVFRAERRQEVISAVRHIGGFWSPTIDIDLGSLNVMVRQTLVEPSELQRLVHTAEMFVGFLITPSAEPGVQLGEVRVTAGGGCPVCGTPMQEQLVKCESCRTPHHVECWDYMGRCSTYACKGRRSVA